MNPVVPALLLVILQAAQAPSVDDPTLAAAVQRFYDTQQREDVAAYLALWSAQAQRPPADQLKYIFDTGDDQFSDIRITRVTESRGRVRVRVSALRQRTGLPRGGGVLPPVMTSHLRASLTYVREGGDWKLLREGQAADELAVEILEAESDPEREALFARDPDLLGPQLLTALARLGGAASISQDYPGALKIYEQLVIAAERGGFAKEQAEGLQNIGNAYYFLRRFTEALAAYERRLALDRGRGDEAGTAAALAGIATIRYSYADYTEALARYREALAIQERLDDVAGIAYTSINIGNITYLQGDFAAAIAAYRRSLELNKSMAYADGESRALEGLGRVFMAQGDYAAALEAFEAVLADQRMQSLRGRLGSAAQNAGDVHFRLANFDAARARYENSRAHFESMKDLSNVGRVLQSMALTELVAARFAAAEDLYKRSGAICHDAADEACSASAVAGLAYAQAAQENYWEAAASYRKAVAAFEALGRREEVSRCEVGLSTALAGAGDFAGAIEAASRARQTAVIIESDDMLWRALTAEARAVRKVGDTARALGVARAAIAALDRMQAASLDRPGTSLTPDASGAFATFAVLQAESGDAVGAFATAERLRALDIRAGLATNEREISRGMTDDERAAERTQSAQLNSRLAQLLREKGLPKPDTARIAELETAVQAAQRVRRTWLDQLFARYPHLRNWRGLGRPREAADAALVLRDRGELIVSFVLDDEDLLVLTAARQESDGDVQPALVVEAHVMHVKRRHVNATVLALQQQAAQNDAAGWQAALNDLASFIPPAVRARLETAGRILVLPHDVLWRVPFEALPSGGRLLGDHATVSVSGSLASLIEAFATPPAPRRLLAIGAPDLAPLRSAQLKLVAPGWALRTSATADAEIQAAAAAYPPQDATVLSGAAATEAAFRDLRDSPMIHVAAPFRINAASPLFSRIVLSEGAAVPDGGTEQQAPAPALPRRPQDDGSLELREIVNLEFGAAAVVFSDGAATSMRDGAAAADVVQWGWLAAGVRTLLIARWPAPPAAGSRLLAEFHKQLQDGVGPAAALRAAQQVLRRDPATAAPLHWAGWMLLGAR